jgi:glycosyltransferase involved in cell wall biosynthesis
MPKNKTLSIIICTYNLAEAFSHLLKELDEQIFDYQTQNPSAPLDLEIVVIDNNSSDNTSLAFKDFVSQKKSSVEINYFLETTQGSSSARNRGIKEAIGDILVFLDDDIKLDKDWLVEISKLSKLNPKMFVAGARVQAQWASALPAWLKLHPPFEIIGSCFPCHDFGLETRTYPFKLGSRIVQNPISACFSASKDIFEKYGNFREDLGIHGDKRGACEDTEFFWRVIAGGEKISYLPQITVIHPIPEKRMTQEFILAWYELLGQTLQYMMKNNLNHLQAQQKNSSAPSDFSLITKKLILKILWILSLASNQPAMSFWLKCQIKKTQGQINLNKKQ